MLVHFSHVSGLRACTIHLSLPPNAEQQPIGPSQVLGRACPGTLFDAAVDHTPLATSEPSHKTDAVRQRRKIASLSGSRISSVDVEVLIPVIVFDEQDVLAVDRPQVV